MAQTDPVANYSADVGMWLDCFAHGKVPLAQVSSSFIIAGEPVDIPPGPAKVVVTVDGTRYERLVQLVKGLSRHARHALVEPREQPPF
jgi:hypothetical protein